jgi:lipopolysaccharide transport system ATP-binding protein
LIVDEVLAVGDAQFQKKCLGKMEDVGKEGRTVLFVSHNMSTIQKLCSTGILLQSGKVAIQGTTEVVIDRYLDVVKQGIRAGNLKERKDRQGTGKVKIIDFFVLNRFGEKQEILKSGEDYILVMEYDAIVLDKKLENIVGSIAIVDNKGEIVFLVRSNFTNQNFDINKQTGTIKCHIKDFNLTTGMYTSMLFLSHREVEVLDFIENATEIIVESGDFFGTGSIGLPSHCKVLTHAEWRVE